MQRAGKLHSGRPPPMAETRKLRGWECSFSKTFEKGPLVVINKNSWNNFGVKARIIDERKLIRIALIRVNLRSLRSIDSTQLSR